MTADPLFSLVVLSFRRFADTTGPCLATLLPQLDLATTELLLVDNGSDDDAADQCAALAAAHPGLRYLPQPVNLGFGGGMNLGVAASVGRWVVLVNSDTLFPPGAWAAFQATLLRVGDDVALVGPVSNSAGNGQCLPWPAPHGAAAGHADVLRIAAQAMKAPTGLLTPTARSDFFCVAVRRSVWDRLGGLDPVFGLGYYEDFDFSLRAHAAGQRQLIAEDVYVVHVGSSVFSTTMKAQQRALLTRNRALLLTRHPGVQLTHVRDDNAAALRHLMDCVAQGGWTAALRARAAWRYAAMLANEPRSPFKRWRWRRAQNRLRRALDDAGIVPAFPPLH